MKKLKMMIPMILVAVSITAINYYYYNKLETKLIETKLISNSFKGQVEQTIELVKKTNLLAYNQRIKNLELINENLKFKAMIIKQTALIQEMSGVLDK